MRMLPKLGKKIPLVCAIVLEPQVMAVEKRCGKIGLWLNKKRQ